jgi:hypothetical protein
MTQDLKQDFSPRARNSICRGHVGLEISGNQMAANINLEMGDRADLSAGQHPQKQS